ncbi:type II toxin-antitoxin system RelE/ParE family toxin [Phyllobacterium sp. BT25]|uniref:Type II toxin-antitoxin system RelE/ParE family toxin n=1 Tax=Phyllobacterium pellucidum TaxID=2740464 RepID=A0A849VQE4_9HYPH|nr:MULTISPECIES: type II toxin-antitoxin system RelE/ParE family toxin [Phyllobacterium]NTS32285.1 type II toxin-antitoxin system RelE/ParE family toxin [Phyllobacterium pellucidum]
MKLAFTDAARSDLLSIGDYIADDNPWRAVTFLEELEARCASIVDFPNSPAVPADKVGESGAPSTMDHERVLFAGDPSSQ